MVLLCKFLIFFIFSIFELFYVSFMLGSYFLCNWLILWQNAFYLYLDRSKLGLMYQEVCCANISSGVIKDMKADPRNKWRKAVSYSLDTSLIDIAIENYWRSSTQARFIEIYNFRISRSEIRLMMTCLIRVSIPTTLVICKTYLKSHHTWKQRPRTHILCVKQLCLYL